MHFLAITLAGLLVPFAAAAQDAERTEESAQTFLSLKLIGSTIFQSCAWDRDGTILSQCGAYARSGQKVWQRAARCQTTIDFDTPPLDWSRAQRVAQEENSIAVEFPHERHGKWRVRFNLAEVDGDTARRIGTAISFLLETCDASRSTGF